VYTIHIPKKAAQPLTVPLTSFPITKFHIFQLKNYA